MALKLLLVAMISLLVLANGSPSCPAYCNKNLTTTMLKLAYTLSGNYTNEDQGPNGEPVRSFFKPVNIPSIFGDLAIYSRAATVDGDVFATEIWALAETDQGYIEGLAYNVTNSWKAPESLTADDMEEQQKECKMFFRPAERNTFVGSRPDCRHQRMLDMDKYYPVYTMIFSCGGITYVNAVPQPLKVESTRIPLRFELEGTRPPLPEFLTCKW